MFRNRYVMFKLIYVILLFKRLIYLLQMRPKYLKVKRLVILFKFHEKTIFSIIFIPLNLRINYERYFKRILNIKTCTKRRDR